jgi:hypothetical protein
VELGQRAKATTVLEDTATELKSRSAPAAAIEKITQELTTVQKPRRQASRRKA